MRLILAARDLDSGSVVELREVTDDEAKQIGDLYEQSRRKYPAPRYECILGAAENTEDFLHNYPRFQNAKAGKGEGEKDGKNNRPRAGDRSERDASDTRDGGRSDAVV
jgi:hypothetical protein